MRVRGRLRNHIDINIVFEISVKMSEIKPISAGESCNDTKVTSSVTEMLCIILIKAPYFSSTNCFIEYIPAGLPLRKTAAFTAPTAKRSLERAECEILITSSSPAKITSCSPTIVPPLTEWIPISLGSLLARFECLSNS